MSLRLCKDCLFYKPNASTDSQTNFDKCENIRFAEPPDLVRGDIRMKYFGFCKSLREDSTLCGMQGAGWEEAPTK